MLLLRRLISLLSAILPIAVWLSAGEALSNELTVQSLYTDCKSEDSFDRAFCLGFLGGVGHTLSGIGQAADVAADYYGHDVVKTAMRRIGVCGLATIGAYRQAFINWAERHPEQWNSHMQLGVAIALRETWPCGSE